MSLSEPLENLVAGEQETAAVRVPWILPVPYHQAVTLTVQTEPGGIDQKKGMKNLLSTLISSWVFGLGGLCSLRHLQVKQGI